MRKYNVRTQTSHHNISAECFDVEDDGVYFFNTDENDCLRCVAFFPSVVAIELDQSEIPENNNSCN